MTRLGLYPQVADVKSFLSDVLADCIDIEEDADTVRITALGEPVFTALKKGSTNVWICRYVNCSALTWPNPDEAAA